MQTYFFVSKCNLKLEKTTPMSKYCHLVAEPSTFEAFLEELTRFRQFESLKNRFACFIHVYKTRKPIFLSQNATKSGANLLPCPNTAI